MSKTRVISQDVGDASITDADVAAANKDGAAGTASLRTLGTGAAQAAQGSHAHAHSATTGITANDHHNRSHDHSSASDNTDLQPATVAFTRPGVGNTTVAARVTGDTFDRFLMSADGKHAWGSGAASQDVYARRSAAKTLTLDADGAGGALTVVEVKGAFQPDNAILPLATITDLRISTAGGDHKVGMGTAFPGSPTDGDLFYRIDNYLWYRYVSALSKWIGPMAELATNTRALPPINATTAIGRWSNPTLGVDNLYLSYVHISAYVAGTHNSSNYWQFAFTKVDGVTSTQVGSTTPTDKSTSTAWTTVAISLGNVLAGAGIDCYEMSATKVGTPGDLHWATNLLYATVGS